MGNKVVDKVYLKCQFQNFYNCILLCCFPKINDSAISQTSVYSSCKTEDLLSCKADISSLSCVAFSGCYSDLCGIPASSDSATCDNCGNIIRETYISCVDSGIDANTGNYYNYLYTPAGCCVGNIEEVEYAHESSIAAFDDSGRCISACYALNSSLSSVATSGCYCDLINQPTYDASTCTLTANLYGTATNASCDGCGQIIHSTYATKNELATHTATFRGSFADWSSVPTTATGYCCNYAGLCAPSANDYMVVQDATGYCASCVGQYRFKYNTEDWDDADGANCKTCWVPEYRVNEVLDTSPTSGSTNGIMSCAVYSGLATKAGLNTATCSANGLMSCSDKVKLDGIASGAEVNVQANWNETDTSSDAYIENKPTDLSDFNNDVGYITSSDSITGNAATATNATNDSDGNAINTTYAKKTELSTNGYTFIVYDSTTWSQFMGQSSSYDFTRTLIKAGNWSVSSQVTLKSNILVEGETGTILTLTSNTVNTFQSNHHSNTVVRNIEFIKNYAGTGTATYRAFTCLIFENCKFTLSSDHTTGSGSTNGGFFYNCNLYNCVVDHTGSYRMWDFRYGDRWYGISKNTRYIFRTMEKFTVQVGYAQASQTVFFENCNFELYYTLTADKSMLVFIGYSGTATRPFYLGNFFYIQASGTGNLTMNFGDSYICNNMFKSYSASSQTITINKGTSSITSGNILNGSALWP